MLRLQEKKSYPSDGRKRKTVGRRGGAAEGDGTPRSGYYVEEYMNQERLLQRFFQYITCASESFRERDFCLMMEDELHTLGIPVQRQEIGELIGSNGWNIRAMLPGEGEPLLLCAHLDTVAPGKGITPTVRDGVIYSEGDTILGADDKAGIAAAMEALQTIVENRLPHRPVELLLTLCEETGILGSKFADYQQIVSREAIVLDDEIVGHMVNQAAAYVKYRFEIQGKSAHAGVCPEKGIHALRAAADCVTRLRCGRISENSVMNVANFLCPGQTNVVPETASFDVELRSYQETELQELAAEMLHTVEQTCAAWGTAYTVRENRISNAFCIPEDTALIRRTCQAMAEMGIEPVIERTLGGSDITWLVENGLTAINIGVGMRDVHGCKEHILFEDMVTTTALLLKLLTE